MKKTLILPKESVTFRSLILDKSWHSRTAHPQFLEEIRAELTHECGPMENQLIDARIKGETSDGVEVEAAFVSAEGLDVHCSHIHIAGNTHFNFAPWRNKAERHAKQWILVRLGLLPLLTALLLFGMLIQENNVLMRQRASLHRLQTQEMKLEAQTELGSSS